MLEFEVKVTQRKSILFLNETLIIINNKGKPHIMRKNEQILGSNTKEMLTNTKGLRTSIEYWAIPVLVIEKYAGTGHLLITATVSIIQRDKIKFCI